MEYIEEDYVEEDYEEEEYVEEDRMEEEVTTPFLKLDLGVFLVSKKWHQDGM